MSDFKPDPVRRIESKFIEPPDRLDGIPFYGVVGEMRVDVEADRVQCHLCGGWFRKVAGTHLTRVHGWSVEEYRDAFRLPKPTATCSPGVSRRQSELNGEMIAQGRGSFARIGEIPEAQDRGRSAGRVPRWRSLGFLGPDLATELHPSRNGKLDAYAIAAGSDRKLWWRCSDGHAWQASVSHRAGGRECPVCAPARAAAADQARREQALRAAPERSLAIRHPDLAAELHPARSADLDPLLVSAGSSRSV